MHKTHNRLKFEWLCNKTETFSQWETPCEGCDRSCGNLTKVSPYRGILGRDRDFIFNRDKVCLNCGTDKKLTIDHIIPISKGGSNHISNLQTLCSKCNSIKSSEIFDYREDVLEELHLAKNSLEVFIKNKGLQVSRIKETTSEESIYIYTDIGVIRISKHHNQKSAEKCICSIVIPIKTKYAEKFIELL